MLQFDIIYYNKLFNSWSALRNQNKQSYSATSLFSVICFGRNRKPLKDDMAFAIPASSYVCLSILAVSGKGFQLLFKTPKTNVGYQSSLLENRFRTKLSAIPVPKSCHWPRTANILVADNTPLQRVWEPMAV